MSEKRRIIFHIDMDHFYTAVEERERPELKGKPVVVGADPKEGKGRGVVFTSNYEARKLGVRSAMPISKAWKLAPEPVYLPPNFELYGRISEEIMNILRKHADKFEQWGIDEAFLDVTSEAKDYADAEALARRIKEEINDKEKLTCSIGVGPNKTVGELAHYDPAVLTEKFGVMGTQLYLTAHGMDKSKVEERGEIKSISRELTFEEDTSSFEVVLKASDRLSEEVHGHVLRRKVHFKTITVKVRYENFETHTHSKTLPLISDRLQDLKRTARQLIQDYFRPERKIRLIGVSVSNFTSAEKQRTLI